jgi:hypothetical protein
MSESAPPVGATQRVENALKCTDVIRSHQKKWFNELRRRVIEDGEPYVIAEAVTPHEILESFDIPYVANEWWSGLVAARRQSGYYLDRLEREGFHGGLPRYGALALATALDEDKERAPWGGLPKPAFILGNINMSPGDCARDEALAHAFGAKEIALPVPALPTLSRTWFKDAKQGWEQIYGSARIDRLVESYRLLVRECEAVTGRRFDADKLRAILDRANQQELYFEDVRQLIQKAPRTPVSLPEQLGNVMTIQWHRGSEWALNAAKMFRDEIAERVAAAVALCPDERYRLMWGGTGLWQNTAFYRAFERSHQTVFVRSIYMSIAIDGYIRFGTSDPLRALASRYAGIMYELRLPPAVTEWTIDECRSHRVNGAVLGPGGSPHQHGATTASHFMVRALEDAGIPTYVMEVDTVDGRAWNEERIMADVTNFIERRVARQG